MGNINDSYFDGYYKDIWRAIIPPDLTRKEVDFMVRHFGLGSDSKVLDMMCGYGRHAVALAEKGIAVTAVDNQGEYIDEIRQRALQDSLPVTPIKVDIASYQSKEQFDLAICMGNSLNFFSEAEVKKILENIAAQLKPEGHILINSWSIAEIAILQFKDRTWSQVGDIKLISDSKYLFHPTRIETQSLILLPNGKTESKTAIDYVFSIAELNEILRSSGLGMEDVYSIPGKKTFSLGEPRAYIVARKLNRH